MRSFVSLTVVIGLMMLFPLEEGIAKVMMMPLNEMVKSSDNILVARVVSTRVTKEKANLSKDLKEVIHRDVNVYCAILEVKRVIKGKGLNQRIQVEYLPDLADIDANFISGEYVFLFLVNNSRREGSYTVFGGPIGKIRVNNNTVVPVHLTDVEGSYDLEEFIKKISLSNEE